jgi:HAD superfamily hydrolase (TIGR01459 family)
MTKPSYRLQTLHDLAHRYRGIVLDLFGTVHDGIEPFPGALDALHHLRENDIRVCLLSNSPRRRFDVAARLFDMGIDAPLYRGLVTSGELVFEDLSSSSTPLSGGRHFYVGPADLARLLDGSCCTRTERLAEADFLLCTGMPDDPNDLALVLDDARAMDLVMVCANPDRQVIVGDTRIDCAGMIAESYEAIGGRVLQYGKPDGRAYRRALSILGLPKEAVLAIGDALETDISGAKRAGLDAALVLTGFHREELVDPRTGHLMRHKLDRLCRDEQLAADFVLRAFSHDKQVP